MNLYEIQKWCNLVESMSIKEWKLKNGYQGFDWINKNEINTILQWYRQKNNKKLRDKLQLQNLTKEDVINKLGYIRIKSIIKQAKRDNGSYNIVMENDKFTCIAPLNQSSARHLARTMYSYKDLRGEDEPTSRELAKIDTSRNNDPNWCIASSSASTYWGIYDLYKAHLLYYFFLKEKKYHGLRFAMVISSNKLDDFINGRISLEESILQFKDPTQYISNDKRCFNIFVNLSGSSKEEIEEAIRKYCENNHGKLQGEEEKDLPRIATTNVLRHPSIDNFVRWGKYVDYYSISRTGIPEDVNWEDVYLNLAEYFLKKGKTDKLKSLFVYYNNHFTKEEQTKTSNKIFEKNFELIKNFINSPDINAEFLYFILQYCIGENNADSILKNPLSLLISLTNKKGSFDDEFFLFAKYFPSLLTSEIYIQFLSYLTRLDKRQEKSFNDIRLNFIAYVQEYHQKIGKWMPKNIIKQFYTNPNKLASCVFRMYFDEYFQEALKTMSLNPWRSLKDISERFNNYTPRWLFQSYLDYYKEQLLLYKDNQSDKEFSKIMGESEKWLYAQYPQCKDEIHKSQADILFK